MLFNAHKKTIESLQHTLAQHTSLLDAIERSMAVIEFDLHGNVLRANANFLQTMGYRADQIEGQSHRMFCTPAFARSAEYSQLWSNLRNGLFQSGTFERVAGDGQSVWLEASYNPVQDSTGQVVKVVKYAMGRVRPQVSSWRHHANFCSARMCNTTRPRITIGKATTCKAKKRFRVMPEIR